MRGITSAGMGLALVQLGLTDVFDVVYGSSAGAFNGAYFVSRQGAFGITIYYEDINNDRFVNLRRAIAGKPVVDLDFVVNEAMTTMKPLDFEAIASSTIPLRVVASNLTRRSRYVFDRFSSRSDLLLKLRASASMPLLAGPPTEIEGELFSDASLYEPVPLVPPSHWAPEDQCTHVLVLRSRPDGVARANATLLEKHLVAKSLRRYGAGLYDDYLHRTRQYAADVACLEEHSRNHSRKPWIYQVVVPAGTHTVSPFEHRRDVLVRSASAGMQAMVKALGADDVTVMELITPVRADGRQFSL